MRNDKGIEIIFHGTAFIPSNTHQSSRDLNHSLVGVYLHGPRVKESFQVSLNSTRANQAKLKS